MSTQGRRNGGVASYELRVEAKRKGRKVRRWRDKMAEQGREAKPQFNLDAVATQGCKVTIATRLL